VLTVSGRLDAENVYELCESVDRIAAGAAIVLDLTDLILADRHVVRLLREFEAGGRIVLRNCPAYIRIWMAAEDIQ
jgi:anti-anti-sigma regulatory factor